MPNIIRAAVIGSLWLGSLFFLFPMLAAELNNALEWPRWHSPTLLLIGRGVIFGGVVVLLWATHVFRAEGGGTPVPTHPTKQLVSSGLYRFSRNPIFLADVVIVLGMFLARGHAALLLYALLVFIGLHLWVVMKEEPAIQERLGEDWSIYASRVPRWFGWPSKAEPDRLVGS